MTGFGAEVQMRQLPAQQRGGRIAGAVRLQPGGRLLGFTARFGEGPVVANMVLVNVHPDAVLRLPFDAGAMILMDQRTFVAEKNPGEFA